MLMRLDRLVNVYVTNSVVNADLLCTLVEICLHCSFCVYNRCVLLAKKGQCFLHILIA